MCHLPSHPLSALEVPWNTCKVIIQRPLFPSKLIRPSEQHRYISYYRLFPSVPQVYLIEYSSNTHSRSEALWQGIPAPSMDHNQVFVTSLYLHKPSSYL